ncbi:hypothetical protein SESBI_09149 [Sesbania bispinosa]|nr:hypothetical protein SESBI_09149 [Sesbania bispinosa]
MSRDSHKQGTKRDGEGDRNRGRRAREREGRTGRGSLAAAKVPVKEYAFDDKKLANVQSQLEKLVAGIYHLNNMAKDAYRSYILAYNSHSMKDIFNVHRLDLQAVAASFCFSNPPKINLNIDSSASKHRKKIRKVEGGRH